MIAVSLFILALMAWVVMIVFGLVPKGFTLTEMVFLYFVITILTISIFTILDVNLRWVPITRDVEGSFAVYICRFIYIPLLVLMAASVLRSHMKAKSRLALISIIILLLCGSDRVYLQFDLLEYAHWNEWISALMYGSFIVIIGWIARWFTGLGEGGRKIT